MSSALNVERTFITKSNQVKCVDFHPAKTTYDRNVSVWTYDGQQIVKSFTFASRKGWIVTGSDNMHVRIFDYNCFDLFHHFQTHSDYLKRVQLCNLRIFAFVSSNNFLWAERNHEARRDCSLCLPNSCLPSLLPRFSFL
ncbi:unnamed protein product [Cylicostephanus goldi]|uniref:Uncharacterized protein n=1 Tax=Cylicostephanus goldi TaxID=71465 RepID=A0A3P7QM87_CYLGO|nr:unnamed protein product [Cylicostephanus goldi]